MPVSFADYAALLPEVPATSEAAAQDPATPVEVETTGGVVLLTLRTVSPQGPGGSLEFQGSSEVPLAQGTYPVRVGDQDDLLFLVPIADDGEHRTYQAVFS